MQKMTRQERRGVLIAFVAVTALTAAAAAVIAANFNKQKQLFEGQPEKSERSR
jgi:hypothetical protein